MGTLYEELESRKSAQSGWSLYRVAWLLIQVTKNRKMQKLKLAAYSLIQRKQVLAS